MQPFASMRRTSSSRRRIGFAGSRAPWCSRRAKPTTSPRTRSSLRSRRVARFGVCVTTSEVRRASSQRIVDATPLEGENARAVRRPIRITGWWRRPRTTRSSASSSRVSCSRESPNSPQPNGARSHSAISTIWNRARSRRAKASRPPPSAPTSPAGSPRCESDSTTARADAARGSRFWRPKPHEGSRPWPPAKRRSSEE